LKCKNFTNDTTQSGLSELKKIHKKTIGWVNSEKHLQRINVLGLKMWES